MPALLLLVAAACRPAPELPPLLAEGCPPGMVRVGGRGEVGMRGQPYGIVVTRHLARVVAPERRCPGALRRTPGALVCWVQTDLVDPVLPPREVELAPFCVDAFPFPGKGARPTADGMTAWDAKLLDEVLSSGRYGPRRLCTFTELQAAVAGLRSNRRFVFGDGPPAPGACPDDAPIGADPGCANPETGVHDYAAVNSHWVVADPDFVAHACPDDEEGPCRGAGGRPLRPGDYVVLGGTRRLQTRQAPLTPHTWHDHGEPNPAGCDAMGHDDQPAICADPDPRYLDPLPPDLRAAEERWARLVRVARETGRFSEVLRAALGRPPCPD